MNPRAWAPGSWRSLSVAQAPAYENLQELKEIEDRLSSYPPLVFEGEVRRLREQLAQVERGVAFLLQGGDCAESFNDFRPATIRNSFRALLQMAVVLTFGSKKPVVKIGRVAGQYAKPRSSSTETRGAETLPAYRGDIINGFGFSVEERRFDPKRMEKAYFHSAATLNLLRAYAKGGFADLHHVSGWNLDFVQTDQRYEHILTRLNETIAFLNATGMPKEHLQTIELFTSHEALLLNYEQALVRKDAMTDDAYAGSAHMLWIGERTRQLNGAHIEFARGITNPLGLKCGPEMRPDELLRIIDILNPDNLAGRLTLIPRMGVGRIGDVLPKLIRRVKGEGRRVVWCCDPMHGNTSTTTSGIKTRSFDDILQETRSFFDIHSSEQTYAGGVHFELTGRDVFECTGGSQKIIAEQLKTERYETLCDPRLNASQALELAFQLVR